MRGDDPPLSLSAGGPASRARNGAAEAEADGRSCAPAGPADAVARGLSASSSAASRGAGMPARLATCGPNRLLDLLATGVSTWWLGLVVLSRLGCAVLARSPRLSLLGL
jgi:hypothetical protein